ncbi:ArnT family glycosyltransferase [Larkinella soli]|uniref:ArnT family glycosyltransferase n=1 Tax=Larkinella soli TaxID=1770527 RepID=UPI000FFB4EC3|nr:glycosyltransferase family 39 protein [Larkinella soli]
MSCLYVTIHFQPPYVDYPGSVHTYLIDWITSVRYSQRIYFALELLLIGSLLGVILVKKLPFRRQSAFLILSALTVLLLRIPNTLLPEQNLDESVIIAGSGMMIQEPKIWGSFDGTTVGPIHYYLLTLSYWLLGAVNYTSIRLIGLIFCIIPGIVFVYHAIRQLYGNQTAYAVAFGYTLCMATISSFEFIAYSSEVVPNLLLAVEVFCLSAVMAGKGFRYAGLLCFVAGLMPYTKLQGVPLAGTLVIYLFIELYRQLTFRKTVVLLLLGLAPTFLVGLYLLTNDLFFDFYHSYILFNLEYAGSGLRWGLVPEMLFGSAETPGGTPDILPYVLFTFAVISLQGLRLFYSGTHVRKIRIIFVLYLLAVVWFSVIKSGQSFRHYLNLFFVPLFWGLGVVWGESRRMLGPDTLLYRLGLYIPFLAIFLVKAPARNQGIEYAYRQQKPPEPLVAAIRALAKPTDRLGIWGHGNLAHLYCHTCLLPGTRDAFASRQIDPSSLQTYFLRRYVGDLHRNRPRFIVEDGRYQYYQTRLTTIDPEYFRGYTIQAVHDSVRLYVRKDQPTAERVIAEK